MTGSFTPYQTLLLLVLNETEQFLDSIELLCRHSMGDTAVLIQRTLFEIYVTLKFLRKHQDFAERYFDFGDYMREKRIGYLESHGSNISDAESKGNLSREEIKAEAGAAVAKHKFSGSKWYPPEFPSLYALCEDLEDKKDYDVVYRYICDFSHFNVLSLAKHSISEDLEVNSATINIEKNPGIETIQGACALVLAILQHFNLEFVLGLEGRLGRIQRGMRQSIPQ